MTCRSASDVTDDLTHDGFLDGRVMAWQPRHGYRAATDPVFLAAACTARTGDRVLELGCGVGVASLCLAARVPGLDLLAVERQASYAALARRNAAEAGLAMHVVEADLAHLPRDMPTNSVNHVIANPPYYAKGAGTSATDAGREAALREDTPLEEWIAAARTCLRPKGWLTMIQSADRLADCLVPLQNGFGSIAIRPLAPRIGRRAGRILIQTRKGGKAPLRLLAPILIHEGERHLQDGDDYTAQARSILRRGDSIPWDEA